MMTTQAILNQMIGAEPVNALTQFMEEHFADFPAVKKKYITAMRQLQQALGEPAKKEAQAIERQIALRLLYSGVLGIHANLDRFKDPVAHDFLNADTEVFLRESTARRLPAYAAAQEARDCFFAALTPPQQAIYEDVAEYVIYLETVGPKLAHYYGYLLGNSLLYHIFPGYHSDPVQTLRYRAMLEAYLGQRLEA